MSRWWVAPSTATVWLTVAIQIDIAYYGLAAMATDSCPDETGACPAEEQTERLLIGSAVVTAVLLVTAWALPHGQQWRQRRNAAAILAAVASVWPPLQVIGLALLP